MKRPRLKEFKFVYDNNNYCVKYTAHLFKRRESQSFYRGFLLETIGQIERILKHAFNNYSMGDYEDTKLVIKFMYEGETYGMLVALEYPNDGLANINGTVEEVLSNIVIITVDKLDSRHYTKYRMFHNESEFLNMLDFELKPSHFSKYFELEHICSNTKNKTDKFFIGKYNSLDDKIVYYGTKINTYHALFDSLLSRLYTNGLTEQIFDAGNFLLDISVDDDIVIYLKMNISTIDITSVGRKHVIVLLNMISLNHYNNMLKNGPLKDMYVDLDRPVFATDASNTYYYKNNGRPKCKGLTIVKKVNKDEQ